MFVKQTIFSLSKVLEGVISKLTTLDRVVFEPCQLTILFYTSQMHQTIVTSRSPCIAEYNILLTFMHGMNSRHLNINIFNLRIAFDFLLPRCTTIFTCGNLKISCQSTHKEFEVSVIQLNNRRFCVLSTSIIHIGRVDSLISDRTIVIDCSSCMPCFTMIIRIDNTWRLRTS